MRWHWILILSLPAWGWNNTGHKTVAYVAYSNLEKTQKQAVDTVMQRHPFYARWTSGVAASERGRAAFVSAATWPDDIRGDSKFHHGEWHYIDFPFSPDATSFPPADLTAPSALTKIGEFRRSVADKSVDEAERAIQASWLIHLVGDVHQPLHATARFIRSLPNGDRGGNLVFVQGASNLHSYWDGLLGQTDTRAFITKLAASIMQTVPKESPVEMIERKWIDESFEISKKEVYSFGDGPTSKRNPAILSDAYKVAARKIARTRAALAGYRLAALFNESFR